MADIAAAKYAIELLGFIKRFPLHETSDGNGHGVNATPDNVSRCRHSRLPHPGPPPKGEGDLECAMRDLHGNARARSLDAVTDTIYLPSVPTAREVRGTPALTRGTVLPLDLHRPRTPVEVPAASPSDQVPGAGAVFG
jgi:hypothetical protein